MGRTLLKEFNQNQFERFDKGESVQTLILERTSFVDQLIKKIWRHFFSHAEGKELALIAVGGYGRAELQPFSDIDLLVLGDDCGNFESEISKFLTFLWDMGFQVGHAVRTRKECFVNAQDDVTTATNLLEARWLMGDYAPFEFLQSLWKSPNFWPTEDFFKAKLLEQVNRHERFDNILYQLEPNVKESPGGLRDIHNIVWIALRHFGATSIQELMQYDFIKPEEYQQIQAANFYLNRLRFALHRMKGRLEDRLLFDHQQKLAEMLDYSDSDATKAVEAFMKPYYQNVHIVAKLNEILLQHFREEIFKPKDTVIKSLNPRFQLVDSYLDVKSENLFQKNPTALLEVFIIIENYAQEIEGIRSRTIRLIRNHLYLIDESFRSDPINKALFIEIFRQPKGVNAALQRMHGYGILGAYLPAFEKITGLMQFNIFHAYTVDEHTLLVMRHLRRLFIDEYAYEFPTAHQVALSICKPEILLLSGLFHDIAKGRDGAHEKLGAVDATAFAIRHNLSEKDSELLSWLVLHHLDFSYIAQKKDLSNPDVIMDFAKVVESQEKLDYLYLLTLADVLSTSKDVWNDWKNQLFIQLYNNTSMALNDSNKMPRSRRNQAIANKEKASELLKARGFSTKEFQTFWKTFESSDFFNKQTANEIAKITNQIIQAEQPDLFTKVTGKTPRGASELLIYMSDRNFLFAQIMANVAQLSLNVMEAKIYSSDNNKTLVLIYFLSSDNEIITDKESLRNIESHLLQNLASPDYAPPQKSIEPRRVRCFETPTDIKFSSLNPSRTELVLNTKEIPRLLAKIGQAFKRAEIRVHDAKIQSVGEKVEDVFVLSTLEKSALSSEATQRLTNYLIDEIE